MGSDISCKPGKEDTTQSTTYEDNTEPFNRLKSILEEIKASCGNICSTNDTGVPGKYYNVIWKDFDCKDLFSNEDFDRYVL